MRFARFPALPLIVVLLGGSHAARAQTTAKTATGPTAVVDGTTVENIRYEFTWHGCDRSWIPCKGYNSTSQYPVLPVLSGRALYFVPLHTIEEVADGVVTLRDGTKLRGVLAATGERDDLFEGRFRKLKGQTALGEIEYPVEKLKSVKFTAAGDAAAIAMTGKCRTNFQSDSKTSATVTLREGDPVEISRFEFLSDDPEGYCYAKTSELQVQIGAGLVRVNLDKIAAVRSVAPVENKYGSVTAVKAQLETKDGQRIDVEIPLARTFIGGAVPFGYVKIRLNDVRSIEVK